MLRQAPKAGGGGSKGDDKLADLPAIQITRRQADAAKKQVGRYAFQSASASGHLTVRCDQWVDVTLRLAGIWGKLAWALGYYAERLTKFFLGEINALVVTSRYFSALSRLIERQYFLSLSFTTVEDVNRMFGPQTPGQPIRA